MALRRGVGIVLTLVGLAILASAAGMAFLYVVVTRGPSIAPDSILMLRVRGDLAEHEPGGVIGQFLVERPTVRSVVESLRKARVDGRVKGVVLAPSGAGALWGKIQEIRDAIGEFRRSGKPIVAYLEYGGARDYYLASACNAIYLMPASPLDLTGLASYELFLRGTLDKLGAYPDLMHIGQYKSARNTFTERTFTAAHREMAESLNRDLYDQLVRGIAEGRRKSEAEVRQLIDQGPFLPEEALRHGLVDDLAYEDQLDDKGPLGGTRRLIESSDYQGISAASLGLGRGPRIAVIYAIGVINTGESRFDSPQGPVLGSDTIVRHIREARGDDSIRAIVLRIDSPGGSAIASDVIWRELRLTRGEKPVISSMSDVAASGGYYIAMPADTIVAQPGTLTGSIGVVVGKFVLEGTYEKLGLNVESVASGRMADMNSPLRPYSDAERAKVVEQMQAVYDDFVEKAAQARRTTPERIDAVAQGRVWTGQQALKIGLVDELGGLERALALAKRRAGIPEDTEVQLVVYPPRRSLYELVRNPLASTVWSGMAAFFRNDYVRAVGTLTAPLTLFRRGEPLAMMPYQILR